MHESRREVLLPADYLSISRECAIPLRTVWRESKRAGRDVA